MHSAKSRQVTRTQLDALQASDDIPDSRKFTSTDPDAGLILDMDAAEDEQRTAMHIIIPNLEDDCGYYHFYH